MKIEENVPLSYLTTFKTGGPARFLLSLDTAKEIRDAVLFAEKEKLPLIPLGAGSNMLAPDAGVSAVFVRLTAQGISIEQKDDQVFVTADAGVVWDALVLLAVSEGWWGIENLSAIPGTVGAAVVQNIGAYGAALSDTLERVTAYDTYAKETTYFEKDLCGFGYRTSIFKKELDRYVITQVTFRLSKTPKPNLSYRDLALRFRESAPPSLLKIREAVGEIRQGKFPPLSEYGTAGSFFLNPIVTEAEAVGIKERYPGMPLFSLPEGGIKVPLAWILDRALNIKGRRMGKAFLWEKQPLVIASELGAADADITELARSVTDDVFKKTGIKIIPEVRVLKNKYL